MEPLLFVLSQTPQKPLALEAIDAVMTAVLFDQDPYVLFIGAGIKQLEQPAFKEKFIQLTELGLKKVYASQLAPNNTEQNYLDSGLSITSLSDTETASLLHTANKILSF